jgi:hypothetical protein
VAVRRTLNRRQRPEAFEVISGDVDPVQNVVDDKTTQLTIFTLFLQN